MSTYVIGLDFGTNSCRSLIISVSDGKELSSHVFPYPSGEAGVIVDPADPNLARQNPADYIEGIDVTIKEAIKTAKEQRWLLLLWIIRLVDYWRIWYFRVVLPPNILNGNLLMASVENRV